MCTCVCVRFVVGEALLLVNVNRVEASSCLHFRLSSAAVRWFHLWKSWLIMLIQKKRLRCCIVKKIQV